jgi:hypothetical protein
MLGRLARGARSDCVETGRAAVEVVTFARVGEEDRMCVDEVGTGVG